MAIVDSSPISSQLDRMFDESSRSLRNGHDQKRVKFATDDLTYGGGGESLANDDRAVDDAYVGRVRERKGVSDDDEGDGKERSLREKVMKLKFILFVRTALNCSGCIAFQGTKTKILNNLPGNVEAIDMVHGVVTNLPDRGRIIMHSREGMTVPSIFLMTHSTWTKYLAKELEDEDLTIDRVRSLIGITESYRSLNFKQWLSDNMHRLCQSHHSGGTTPYVESILTFDMSYPLIDFPDDGNSQHDKQSSCHKHGKAYLMTGDKCSASCR